jgi:hypothetical protein
MKNRAEDAAKAAGERRGMMKMWPELVEKTPSVMLEFPGVPLKIRPARVMWFPMVGPTGAGFVFEGVLENGEVIVADPPFWVAPVGLPAAEAD